MDDIVTCAQLAELFRVAEPTVIKLAAMGVVVRASRGRYELAASIGNYCEKLREAASGRAASKASGMNIVDESALLKREQRKHYELKNAELERAVVRADDVTSVMQAEYGTVRAAVFAMPAKLAPRLAILKSPGEVVALLESEFFRALEGLSTEAGVLLEKIEQRQGLN